MRVLVDTGQQKKKHELKHNCLKALGAELLVVPLPVGDYVLENEKVADVLRRKQERGVAVKKIDLQGTTGCLSIPNVISRRLWETYAAKNMGVFGMSVFWQRIITSNYMSL